MQNHDTRTLINPETGNLAFKIYRFEDCNPFDHIHRLCYYSMILVTKGSGRVKADFAEHDFEENALLSFSPYQPFMLTPKEELSGWIIHFHSDFFCIHKHHKEVACDGVLFNGIYNPPLVHLDDRTLQQFHVMIDQIRVEMENPALAHSEVLISYLKILLIAASRLKKEQETEGQESSNEKDEPLILQKLKKSIEKYFRTKHAPSDYADLLAMSPKALARLTKNHYNKTLTDLISERIVIEAKRELYLTNKTVKEIAYDLGYEDEYYFSRFFKKNTDVSPQLFRETVGMNQNAIG